MKCYCQISGVEFFSSEDFKEENTVQTYHPIFLLPARSLLAKAQKFGKFLYSEREEKLLFLALLHATEAVKWEVPAAPTEQTVKKNMESVFKLLAWYEKISQGSLRFPELRVTAYNYTLDNIGVFITSWYECRKEYMAPESRRLLAAVLEEREYKLTRLINSPRDTFAFAGKLWDWAKVAADISDPGQLEEWGRLFTLNLNNGLLACSELENKEIEDMRDWMQEHLYATGSIGAGSGSSYSAKVLEHTHKLVNLSRGGMTGYLSSELGGPQNTFQLLVEADTSDGVEKLQELEAELVRKSEEKKVSLHILQSFSQPDRINYKGRLSDWIRDNSTWVGTVDLREQIAYLKKTKGLE